MKEQHQEKKRCASDVEKAEKTVPSEKKPRLSPKPEEKNERKQSKKRVIVISSESDDAFIKEEKVEKPVEKPTKKPRTKKEKTSSSIKVEVETKPKAKAEESIPKAKVEENKPKAKVSVSGSYRPRWMASDREPPKHGSKPIPRGKPDCLSGMVFVLTGLNESLTRDEMSSLIQKHGGYVKVGVVMTRVEKTAVSGKTTYLVAGFEMEDGRPIQEGSKYKKAIEKDVKIINEDKLLKMIRDSDPQANAVCEVEEKKVEETVPQNREIPAELKKETYGLVDSVTCRLLTTKYAPQEIGSIIGNTKTIENLVQWLERWESVHIKSNPLFWYLMRRNIGCRMDQTEPEGSCCVVEWPSRNWQDHFRHTCMSSRRI